MKPSAERVYQMLREAGSRGVTSGEFAKAFVLRYSARVKELRDLGMVIHAERLQDRSTWRYWLQAP